MLVPVARAQVTQYLVFISQEVVDTVDDRIKAWLSLEIDIGLETGIDTVVGVLLIGGHQRHQHPLEEYQDSARDQLSARRPHRQNQGRARPVCVQGGGR